MAANMTVSGNRLWRRMRWVVWGGAGLLLLLPLVAMRFTPDVRWTLSDFATMGLMLGLVAIAFEATVRVARSNVYVIAAGVAVANAFLLTWVNLAVGIIGSENNPQNLVFFGVLAVGLVAVTFNRLKSLKLARAMEATALAQAATSAMTLAMGEGYEFLLTGFFVALWLISAQLFRKAARQEAEQGRAG
ncbi:MAG: hypothetical protein ABWZ08_11045 [Pseudoxanthomonas sp.]